VYGKRLRDLNDCHPLGNKVKVGVLRLLVRKIRRNGQHLQTIFFIVVVASFGSVWAQLIKVWIFIWVIPTMCFTITVLADSYIDMADPIQIEVILVLLRSGNSAHNIGLSAEVSQNFRHALGLDTHILVLVLCD